MPTLGQKLFYCDKLTRSFSGAAEGKDQKFLVINEPGEVKGEEIVGSEEEKVDEEDEEEEEEELPKLIKSDEKCDDDRGKFQLTLTLFYVKFIELVYDLDLRMRLIHLSLTDTDSAGPPQLTRQVPAKEESEEEEEDEESKDKVEEAESGSAEAASSAPVLEAMMDGGPPPLPPPITSSSPKKSSLTTSSSSSDLTKSLRKVSTSLKVP